jgi:nucleoid DNA-binding protein
MVYHTFESAPESINRKLACGEEVKISGFGTVYRIGKKAGNGRNPQR